MGEVGLPSLIGRDSRRRRASVTGQSSVAKAFFPAALTSTADRKKITVDDVKSIGTYSALIDLHKEVKHKISLNVIAAEDNN